MSNPELISMLAAASMKSVAILALAGLVTALWRTSSASARHLVWTIGVAACLTVPALEAIVSRLGAPAIRIQTWNPPSAESPVRQDPAPALTADDNTPIAEKTAARRDVSFSTSAAPPLPTPVDRVASRRPSFDRIIERIKAGILYIWLGGLLMALLPVAAAIARIRILAKRSAGVTAGPWSEIVARTPAIEHLSGKIRIIESTSAVMPMTWGILTPTLLVPSGASHWPEWKCRNILLHELAHVERRDCLTQLLAQIACAVYWFNPLVWIAAHRMRVERELACDDRVLSAGSIPSDYAANLLDVARSLRAPSLTSSTAIAMARPSQLSGRLLAVLDATRNRSSVTSRIRAGISCAALAVVIPMSFIIPGAGNRTATPAIARVRAPAHATKLEPVPQTPAEPVLIRASKNPSVSVFVSTSAAGAPSTWPMQQGSPCWAADGKGSTHVSSSTNDDGDSRQSFEVRYTRENCSVEATAQGKFTLRPDLSDVETISSDGWFRVEERIGRDSKRVEIRRASNGSLDHQYWVNGDRTPFNDEARAWLARTLLSIERKTAVAASTRVPQLYRSGGLRGLLSEIAQMESAYGKSAYYKTFLGMGVSLDANTLNTVVRQATTDLSSSDYYLSEVLSKFASQPAVNEATWRTFADAAGTMKSDYYRSETLKKVLRGGRLSGQTVGFLLNSASGMKSDYYLSELLQAVASQYAVNANTRQYYVDALRKIDSDYYRGQVLETLSRDGTWDAKTTNLVLASVGEMKSEYYRAEALKSLIKAKHVTDWPTFFSSTAGIPSDYYKRDVLSSALRQTPLSRELVSGVLTVAARMKSDNDISEVLAEVARVYRIDDNLRPAYEKAIESIDSDYYRGAAQEALRRSMAR